MNKAALVRDLKNMIGPAGKGSEVSDSDLTVWLNEAKDKVVAEILDTIPDYYNKVVTTTLIANQNEYSLPDDFEKILWVSLSYDGSNWYKVLPLNNVGQATDIQQNVSTNFTQSQPFYYLVNGAIGILPTPDAIIDNGLKISYSYLPDDMSEDSDEPDIPKRFHKYLKYWAYANYLDQNDEHVAAERMRLRFDALITKQVDALSDRVVDRPKTVEIYDDDQGLYLVDY